LSCKGLKSVTAFQVENPTCVTLFKRRFKRAVRVCPAVFLCPATWPSSAQVQTVHKSPLIYAQYE
jgi:hypothetical protein